MQGMYGRGTGWGASRRCAILFPVAACATSAFAAVLSGPGASNRIPAGRVEVVALEPAMTGVEERELVLSLDGGKTFPLRLTGEIGPGDRAASWRVPALPTEHAVLALREGGDGIEEGIVAVSAEFVILPGPGVPAEKLCFRDGEWKTREADPGQSGLPAPSFGGTDPGRWTPLDDTLSAYEEPVRALPSGPEDLAVSGRGPTLDPRSDASATRARVSLFLPLRE